MSETRTLDTSGFTGTSQWHRISPLCKVVLTDGVLYVAKETNNGGLFQDIGIDLCYHEKFKPFRRGDEYLIVIDIDTEGEGLTYMDGNKKKIHTYKLTGYPPLKITVWASMADEVSPCIFLPSEY